MRSKAILGLMAFVMITACGKSMQVTLKNGAKTDAAKASVLKTAPGTGASSASDLSPSTYDGKLGALSEYDLSNVKDGYPFLNAGEVATSNSVRTLGSFAYSVEKDGEQHGFVKSSNLVFRAI
ncbi:MAG: hypothetical protein H7333_09820, partial [Bdellovibrionales bacterium]|nr:hypothetical protein [Oligoflexia bacterium]